MSGARSEEVEANSAVELQPRPESPAPVPVPLAPDEGVDLSWEGLGYRVNVPVQDPETHKATGAFKWKNLIRDFGGVAPRGRLLAIMGPSGAGKTTFLNSIAGRIRLDEDHEVVGVAFLNKTVFSNDYKKALSFVSQDDIVMGKETPREALYFNYRIKLNASAEEAEIATNEMLRRLHLTKCAETLLGVPGLIKGVSGGEKKRTNIGSELITNPRVLILDEPTTGLDSVNAFRVGELLKELAHKEGRTVLCTIHTPSSELFAEFDDVMLVAKGRIAYHGPRADAPAYFASKGYPLPPRYNPSEFYMNLLQLDDQDALDKLLDDWEDHKKNADTSSNPCLAPGPRPEEVQDKDELLLARCKAAGCSYGTQLSLLTARGWRIVRRDPVSTIGRAFQTIFFAVLIGLFYLRMPRTSAGVQDRLGAMFMVSVNAVFLSLMNGVTTFPPERAVFLMEQSNDTYNAFIYFFAKIMAELPFQLFFPMLYSCIIYWMIGLEESAAGFFIFMLIIVLTGNCSYSVGLLATAFFPTMEVAMAFIPVIILPLMIVGGLFANTERLDPYFVWLNYISFPRYAFTGIAINEFSRIDSLCGPGQTDCRYQNGDEVLASYGFTGSPYYWWFSAIMLAIIMIVCWVLAATALYIQGKNRRSNLSFHRGLAIRDAAISQANSPINHSPTAQEQ